MFFQTRTFWITLTLAAVVFTGQQWLGFPLFEGGTNTSKTAHIPGQTVTDFHSPSSTVANHPPIPKNLPAIKEQIGYPPIAKNAGIEGRVILRILVDEKGNYVKHSVVDSFHPMLRIPVELHVPLVTFEPAKRMGKATSGWVSIPFQFDLSGS
ncbi:MAG: energy transducer TonB [Bacteroidota bacterium]